MNVPAPGIICLTPAFLGCSLCTSPFPSMIFSTYWNVPCEAAAYCYSRSRCVHWCSHAIALPTCTSAIQSTYIKVSVCCTWPGMSLSQRKESSWKGPYCWMRYQMSPQGTAAWHMRKPAQLPRRLMGRRPLWQAMLAFLLLPPQPNFPLSLFLTFSSLNSPDILLMGWHLMEIKHKLTCSF